MQRTSSRALRRFADHLSAPSSAGFLRRKPKRITRPQLLDTLETRCVPATLYVGLPTDFSITKDIAPTGLSANDTVTWKGADSVDGLTFGTNAFSSVSSAVSAAAAGSTLKFAADTYSDGAVTVNVNNLTFDIPLKTGGFSLTAGKATNLTLTGAGSVSVTANDGGVTVIGNSGKNVLSGGTGNDVFQGGAGKDTIVGGAGIDTVQYNEDFGNYTVLVKDGVVTVIDKSSDDEGDENEDDSGSGDGTDTITGVEVLQFKDKSVRVIPTSGGFIVGTTAKPVATGLNFGASFVNTSASGDKIQVNLGLDGKTTSGWFSASDDSTLSSISVNQTNIQLTGSARAINAFLNSGKIQYVSASNDQRTITLTCSNDNVNPQAGYMVIAPATSTTSTAPVFTSANSASADYGKAWSFAFTATSSPASTFSVTAGSLPKGLTLDSASGVLAGQTAVGTYTFTVTATSGSLSASQPFTLTINKASLTITVNAAAKTYGDADPSLTYSITAGSLASGDSLTGSLSRASGENVGTYAINQNTLTAGSNYTITFVGANFTINKATLSIIADAKSKTYGDDDPSLSYQVNGLKNGDSLSCVTGSLSRSSGDDAGSYTIGAGTVNATPNYTVTYTPSNLTVNKATLTIIAEAKSKRYGESDGPLTYRVSGLKRGDSSSIVKGNLSRSSGEKPGSYTIGSGSVSTSPNYIINFAPAPLTITQTALTITADAKSKTYGDTDPTLTYTVTSGSLATGDSITGAIGRSAGENTGSYAISQNTLTAGANYTVTFVGANLSVNQATLSITADAKLKTFGDADPTFTYQVSGLKNGDTSSVVTGSLSRSAGANVGAYSIGIGSVSATSNYTVSYTAANLTVNKATLSIIAAAKSKTYGDSDPSFTYQVSGLKNGDTSSIVTGTLSRSAGANVGTYSIGLGSVSATSNYTVSYTAANLTVNKATLSIIADAKSKTYGDSDPSFTYQVSGLKNGDTSSIVTGTLSRSAGENVANYAISIGSVATTPNYSISFGTANLSIQKRSVQITAADVNGSYGNATLGVGFTVSNMASGESIGTVDFATTATRSASGNYQAGNWVITATGARSGNFDPNNYAITYLNGQFNVAKATLNVTATGSSRSSNGNALASVTLSDDRKPGDLFTVTPTSTTFSDANVGFFKTITASGLTLGGADAGNYTFASSTVTASGNITGSGVINNVLTVIGTDDAEEIIIGLNMSNKTEGLVTRIAGGVTTVTKFPLAGLTRVIVHGSGGNEKLTMNAEVPLPCTLYGDEGNDILRGGNYDDSLYGGNGDDTLYGSLGNDYLDGGNGSDTLNGQDGNDTLVAGLGDTLSNKLDGGDGSDILYGSNGSNTLTGGTDNANDGSDTIYGYDGNNTIFGGGGNDVVIAGNGINSVEGASGNDSITLGNGNNTVNDVSGDDVIVAGDGNNTINAGIGNDSVTVGNGNNTIQGGDGNDTITVGGGGNLVFGSNGDDTIIADNGNNILVGGAGADAIRAGAGNNLIIGGTGVDKISAGDGSNLIIGGYTSYDSNATSLRAIESEWIRTDITIQQKQSELTTGINGIKLAVGSTVIDDLALDLVTVGKGKNWIWS